MSNYTLPPQPPRNIDVFSISSRSRISTLVFCLCILLTYIAWRNGDTANIWCKTSIVLAFLYSITGLVRVANEREDLIRYQIEDILRQYHSMDSYFLRDELEARLGGVINVSIGLFYAMLQKMEEEGAIYGRKVNESDRFRTFSIIEPR